MEIISKDQNKIQLTITSTRVTIKFNKEIFDESKIIELVQIVKNTLGEIDRSWRGIFSPDLKSIEMFSNRKIYSKIILL